MRVFLFNNVVPLTCNLLNPFKLVILIIILLNHNLAERQKRHYFKLLSSASNASSVRIVTSAFKFKFEFVDSISCLSL